MTYLKPVTLTGELVSLSPLTSEDTVGLAAAAADGDLHTLSYTSVPHPDRMSEWVDTCLERRTTDTFLPFVTRRLDTGAIIGMTTYCNVSPADRHIEIGHTWNAASAQRTGTNTESKLLLMQHAFESLDAVAVEFRTHWLNQQSRRAIERLGAKLDGVLRNHRLMPDGTLRDTACYSVLPHEWPGIAVELRRKLAAH